MLGCLCAAILEDCPIYSTLSYLTATPIAAGNTVVLLVKPLYSAIALSFAVVLFEAGLVFAATAEAPQTFFNIDRLRCVCRLPPGVLNVIPQMDETLFPIVSSYYSRVIGVIPPNIPSSDKFHFTNGMCAQNLMKSVSQFIATLCNFCFAVIFKKNSLCPVIILKSADIDSAIDCFLSSTQTNEVSKQIFYSGEMVLGERGRTTEFAVCTFHSLLGVFF